MKAFTVYRSNASLAPWWVFKRSTRSDVEHGVHGYTSRWRAEAACKLLNLTNGYPGRSLNQFILDKTGSWPWVFAEIQRLKPGAKVRVL
jgi:hypothetical protein